MYTHCCKYSVLMSYFNLIFFLIHTFSAITFDCKGNFWIIDCTIGQVNIFYKNLISTKSLRKEKILV